MGGSISKDVWSLSRVVSTKYGQLQGKRLSEPSMKGPVDVFLGIPFAAPPVGPKRFKKPEPPVGWEGIRDAAQWGQIAIQKTFIMAKKGRPKPSEDCLYLNVFAPTWTAPAENPNGFPVMVFIHGGGFSMGNAFDYGDDGISKSMVTKDIIAVTIQYRLGFLGFWYTGDDCIPANLGLWDQTAALQWVQDNIAAFGGDPNNVTVVGQSAGGASADLLTLSPHSNCLFHKCIAMSGNGEMDAVVNSNAVQRIHCEAQGARMKLSWSSPEEMYEKLMEAPSDAFGHSLRDPMTGDKKEPLKGLHVAPVVDGDFFPESYAELRKKAPLKPFITGVVKYEALLGELMNIGQQDRALQGVLETAIPDEHKNCVAVREQLKGEYKIGSASKAESTLGRINLASDTVFNLATWKLARNQVECSKGRAPVFFYLWNYCNPKSWSFARYFLPVAEAAHASELSYLFGKASLSSLPIIFNHTWTADDETMCNLLTTSFANFMKHGDPNGPKGEPSCLPLAWPEASMEHRERHVILDTTTEVRDSFFDGRVARLHDLRTK